MDDLPTPKTDVGETFRKRLVEMAAASLANASAALGNGPSVWYRPEGLDEPILSVAGNTKIHDEYSRDEQEKWFDESTKNRNSPGTVGDFAQIQLQGDFLACMERSYRERHKTSAQSRIQPSSRLMGHGHEFGIIRGSMLGYIQGIDKINKGEKK
jgi:hypothetical protein